MRSDTPRATRSSCGLYQVAAAARVTPAIAWLYPLITDGLALVAYAAALVAAVSLGWSTVSMVARVLSLATPEVPLTRPGSRWTIRAAEGRHVQLVVEAVG